MHESEKWKDGTRQEKKQQQNTLKIFFFSCFPSVNGQEIVKWRHSKTLPLGGVKHHHKFFVFDSETLF